MAGRLAEAMHWLPFDRPFEPMGAAGASVQCFGSNHSRENKACGCTDFTWSSGVCLKTCNDGNQASAVQSSAVSALFRVGNDGTQASAE